jgi:hypothetical protein
MPRRKQVIPVHAQEEATSAVEKPKRKRRTKAEMLAAREAGVIAPALVAPTLAEPALVAPTLAEPALVEPVVDKPKRKRRTKAEMLAARAAADPAVSEQDDLRALLREVLALARPRDERAHALVAKIQQVLGE